jgi:hypothetical protein
MDLFFEILQFLVNHFIFLLTIILFVSYVTLAVVSAKLYVGIFAKTAMLITTLSS